MSAHLDTLRASVERLQRITGGFTDADLVTSAYPSEWSIADVLSHIGSSAVIWQRRMDDSLAGLATPDDLAPAVWAEWDAKPPRAKAADGTAADRRYLERLESLTGDERTRVQVSMGPIEFGFEETVRARLSEHVLHTWDIEVVHDPAAALPADATALIIDHLALIARYTGRPTGATRSIVVRTTDPERTFTIALGPERVGFDTAAPGAKADVDMPAEALVRLVYGRLDPGHTPPLEGVDDVAELRTVFRGL